jgi:hypothetical protein
VNRRISLSVALLGLALFPGARAQDAGVKELVVIDLRPAEEKSGHALTPLSGKCNKDVFRIADVASDPSKLVHLADDLRTGLGALGNGKTLTVLNWSIYYNKQVRVSGGGLGSIGVQGYSLPGKKKERKAGSICSREESAGGWYSANELTSTFFPLISEFEGTLAGKVIRARVVHSPGVKLEGEFTGGASDTEQLVETVHETATALLTEAMAVLE